MGKEREGKERGKRREGNRGERKIRKNREREGTWGSEHRGAKTGN